MWPILGFWLRDQNVVTPIGEILSSQENVHFPQNKILILSVRNPICGKMDTPTTLNAPLYLCLASKRSNASLMKWSSMANLLWIGVVTLFPFGVRFSRASYLGYFSIEQLFQLTPKK